MAPPFVHDALRPNCYSATMRWTLAVLALAICSCACVREKDPDHVDTSSGVTSRFVALGAETVRDTTTDLVWTAGDNEKNFAWPEAEAHCTALRLDEESDWRLPEIGELEAIYDEAHDRACGERTCHLDPAITLTDPYVWSGTSRSGGRRFYIDFKFGTQLAPLIRPQLVRRVLCVRRG